MIYPKNFESKIGFDEVRAIMKSHCLSTMGKETVGSVAAAGTVESVEAVVGKAFVDAETETRISPLFRLFPRKKPRVKAANSAVRSIRTFKTGFFKGIRLPH